MSNIIKNSAEFIPEKIIHEGEPQGTVWGNIVNEAQLNQSAGNTTPSVGATRNDNQDQQGHLFDSDFSSPVQGQVSDDDKVDTQTIEQTEEKPPIDINAIAEDHFNMGVQAGIEQAQNEYGSSMNTLLAICEELSTIRETILQNSAGEMRKMVLQIAEKIIRHSLAYLQQTIIETVNEALQKALKSDDFVVSVNPEDLEVISSHSAEIVASVNGLKNIIVKPDVTIDQGGCFIESSNCTVDATIISQLEIISETLKD